MVPAAFMGSGSGAAVQGGLLEGCQRGGGLGRELFPRRRKLLQPSMEQVRGNETKWQVWGAQPRARLEPSERSARLCRVETLPCCCGAARTARRCDLESLGRGFQHLALTPHNAKVNSSFRLMSTFSFIATAKCEDYINLHLLCESNAFQIIAAAPQRYRREFPGSCAGWKKLVGSRRRKRHCVFS